jgi:hypothetical protein
VDYAWSQLGDISDDNGEVQEAAEDLDALRRGVVT